MCIRDRTFSQKRVLKSALNWYRANLGRTSSGSIKNIGEVQIPTLLIWGNRDPAIGRAGIEENAKYMKGPYTFIELDSGHWLIQESFQKVSEAIIDHVNKYSISTN